MPPPPLYVTMAAACQLFLSSLPTAGGLCTLLPHSSSAPPCTPPPRLPLRTSLTPPSLTSQPTTLPSSPSHLLSPLSTRSSLLRSLCTACLAALASTPSSPCFARNLPEPNGAIGDRRGQIETLLPIVRASLVVSSAAETASRESPNLSTMTPLLSQLPQGERAFKRMFDEYSVDLTYKQQCKGLTYVSHEPRMTISDVFSLSVGACPQSDASQHCERTPPIKPFLNTCRSEAGPFICCLHRSGQERLPGVL